MTTNEGLGETKVQWLRHALEGTPPAPSPHSAAYPVEAVVVYSSLGPEQAREVEAATLAAFDQVLLSDPAWPVEPAYEYLRLLCRLASTWASHGLILTRLCQVVEVTKSVEWRVELLQALLELGHIATVEFWRREWIVFGSPAASIVAGGLARHSVQSYLDWAVAATAADDEAIVAGVVVAIRETLELLTARHGRTRTNEEASRYDAEGKLTPQVRSLLRRQGLLDDDDPSESLPLRCLMVPRRGSPVA